MKIFSLALLLLSGITWTAHSAETDAIVYYKYKKVDGVITGQRVEVTAKDVASSSVSVLGYVRDLLTRNELCYTGNPKKVLRNILDEGVNHRGDETCEEWKVKGDVIVLGFCNLGNPVTTYSLMIGHCE